MTKESKYTKITSLPENLTVGGYLDFDGRTDITELPKNSTVYGWLDLKSPYSLERSENNAWCLCRNKPPRWRMQLQDEDIDTVRLATSLRKAAEYLVKKYNKNK